MSLKIPHREANSGQALTKAVILVGLPRHKKTRHGLAPPAETNVRYRLEALQEELDSDHFL